MKLFMKSLVASFVIVTLISTVPFQSTCKQLNNDVLRLHIIANSDSEADQKLKLYVRDSVLDSCSSLYSDVSSKSRAEEVTRENLTYIKNSAQKAVFDKGYDYDVDVSLTETFFDTRYYDDFTMPAGVYDAVQIKIGKAEGKNWWCVMYPTLCVGASSKISMQEDLSEDEFNVITEDDVEYKFKIVEYYEKISSFFS